MKRQAGFTLVEMMIVVVIIGILAAIAIPAFIKYVRNSKTSEARENLAYIFRESSTYYQNDRSGRGIAGAPIDAQFPDANAMTPAAIPAGVKVVTTTWNSDATWNALKFSIADPHYYAYQYGSDDVTTGFSAMAFGDLDGDSDTSLFERQGTLNDHYEVQGSAALYEANPTD